MKEGEIPSRRLIGRREEKEKVFDSYICKNFHRRFWYPDGKLTISTMAN